MTGGRRHQKQKPRRPQSRFAVRLTRLLTGDTEEPVDVTVEVEEVPYKSEVLLQHNIRSVVDFTSADFFVPLIILGMIFAGGILFGFLVQFPLQLYLLYDLLSRVRRRPSGPAAVGMTPPHDPRSWLWCLLLYIPSLPVLLGAAFLNLYLYTRLFGEPDMLGMEGEVIAEMSVLTIIYLLIIFFLVVVMAPLTEEIWFRGIGLAGFIQSGSRLRAIVWTSVIFGILHGPTRVLFSGLFGLVLAVVRFRTGSLYCCLALHALHNFLVLAAAVVYALYSSGN